MNNIEILESIMNGFIKKIYCLFYLQLIFYNTICLILWIEKYKLQYQIPIFCFILALFIFSLISLFLMCFNKKYTLFNSMLLFFWTLCFEYIHIYCFNNYFDIIIKSNLIILIVTTVFVFNSMVAGRNNELIKSSIFCIVLIWFLFCVTSFLYEINLCGFYYALGASIYSIYIAQTSQKIIYEFNITIYTDDYVATVLFFHFNIIFYLSSLFKRR